MPSVNNADSLAPVDTANQKPMPLRGATRVGAIVLGVLFLALPIAAYFDARLGLLGASDKTSDAFGLVMAIFVVLGGVLLISGIIGMWLMWKDVGPLNESSVPDVDRISIKDPSLSPVKIDATAPTRLHGETYGAQARVVPAVGSEPPFTGQQREVDLLEADVAFVDAARSYYDEFLSSGIPFSRAVVSVWRSKHGRPNYYFEVRVEPDEIRWIRVPHRGKAGAGAGAAGE